MLTTLLTAVLVASVAGQGLEEPVYDYYDEPLPAPAPPNQNRQIKVPVQQAPSQPTRFTSLGSGGDFRCPEPFGFFADPKQCDKYYQCDNEVPIEKLCDDGLVYDIAKGDAGHADPCDSPYVVDCTERKNLQAATHISEYCPRRHGSFAHPDFSICNIFYNCVKGVHTETTCATGLHFDEKTGTCTWPNMAKRQDCAPEKAQTLKDGFQCPNEDQVNELGVKIPHPTYPNDNDCAKFYVCLNGEKPQEASCSLGKVFNAITNMCDLPENVPECAKYYDNFYDDYDNGIIDGATGGR